MKLTLFLFSVFSVSIGLYFGITNNSADQLGLGLFFGGLFWFVCMVLVVADLMPMMKSKHRKKKKKLKSV